MDVLPAPEGAVMMISLFLLAMCKETIKIPFLSLLVGSEMQNQTAVIYITA